MVPPTMLSTQEGTSRNMTQFDSSVILHHLVNLQVGSSSQGPRNNLACCSSQKCHISLVLEGILDEKYIEECLIPSKILSHKHEPYAMNENDRRQHGGHRSLSEIIRRGKSVYRGVIKCNYQRFEAFVWDNSDPGKRGRPGAYSTEVDAAKAHDLVSVKIGGLNALTNFPVRCYSKEMDEMRWMSTRDYISAVRWTGKDYSDGDSPYRGVYRSYMVPIGKKWEARLGREGSPNLHLGTYYTPEDAARAFDIISIKIKGRDAITNSDLNSYEVDGIMKSQITTAMDGSITLKVDGVDNETEAYPPQTQSVFQHNHQQFINSSSFSRRYQNHNLFSSNPYALGGFIGGVGSSGSGNAYGNSIVNLAAQTAQFTNQNDTLQQPLQTQQSQVNVNNFNQNIRSNNINNNNKQFLSQDSNRSVLSHAPQNLNLDKCVPFPDWPSGFGLLGGNLELEPLRNINSLNVQPLEQVMVNESTGATNGVSSLGTQIQPVEPSNQEFGATQLPFLEVNQSFEPYNFQANTLNQIPHGNLNSSLSDSFQNPSSETNNNGSPGETSGCPIDLDMRDYLNRSYIEDKDFACDFDMFGALVNEDRQGL
ncbi:hypothetical protein JHK82_053599 [Glycine max]|nr:hypothetical protein JHK85_054393 [Glycine max]KAG5083431.1 hypothetical protein JHK84_053469 [Glycine max]KAG5086202.1 hypothetical protein JHK82_053599 [Glycine max]